MAVIIMASGLTACSTLTGKEAASGVRNVAGQAPHAVRKTLLSDALAALGAGDTEKTIPLAQDMVLDDIRSASGHLILAAAYHLNGDQSSLDLAGAGYKTAGQFAGQDHWTEYLSGVVAIQRHQHAQALDNFAAAALNAPDNAFVFEGLAAAAYMNGHLGIAEAAAERARKLSPESAIGWQLLTLVKAAQGQNKTVQQLIHTAPPSVGGEQRGWVRTRAATLIRTGSFENANGPATAVRTQLVADPFVQPPQTQQSVDPAAPGSNQQLTVDVTVILSDERKSTAYGVNLLDGLQGIYSFGKDVQVIKSSGGNTDQTSITRAIRTPDITYNLNLFNRGGRYYEAIARPSLTAFVGEPSSFFIGEQLIVNVAGVQAAQIERIDVGVSLKITPVDIRADGSRFRVEVDRGFFSEQNTSSFRESVSTFKQSVAATADVKFGETLILSGLTESVTDGVSSRTPVLGDIPVLDTLFSRSTKLKRTRSAIILVTPSQPGFINRTINTSAKVERLVRLWDSVIEPRIGVESLLDKYLRGPNFSRSAAGDVQVRDLHDPALRSALIHDVKRMSQSL
jgi:tetratricopeptide (TPR) repeat protein